MNRRVLVFTARAWPTLGGGSLSGFRFARYLVERGHEVVQLSLDWDGQDGPRGEKDGVKILRLPYASASALTKARSFPRRIPGYLRAIRWADVVILYGPVDAYAGVAWLAGKLGKRVIYRGSMWGVDDGQSLLERAKNAELLRRLLDEVDVHYALTPEFGRVWQETFPGQEVVVTAQGVDLERFCAVDAERRRFLREKLGWPQDKTVVVSVGWVTLRKGIDAAIAGLAPLGEHVHYALVGGHVSKGGPQGQDQAEMDALVSTARAQLGERLHLMGPMDAVEEALQAADVFLLASRQEGLPNVVLEAMATGVPCVVRSLPGVDGYLTHDGEDCLTFAEDAELGPAVQRLLADPALARELGAAGRAQIEREFSYEAVASRLLGPKPKRACPMGA